MAQHNSVIVLKKGRAIPESLGENLQMRGFRASLTHSLQEALDTASTVVKPILVVDAGIDGATIEKMVKELIEATTKRPLPIVLVGKKASSFQKTLDGKFPVVTGVNSPCRTADILDSILWVSEGYDEFVERSRNVESIIPPKPIAASSAQETEIVQGSEDLTNQVFEELSKLGISQQTLGGFEYSHIVGGKDGGQLYLSSNEKCRDAFSEFVQELAPKDIGRLTRVGFLADAIAKALCFVDDDLENIRQGAMLYSWAFAGGSREYFTKDYSTTRKSAFRRELCSKLKDSAMKVAVELGQPTTGNLIAKFARLVAEEEGLSDDKLTISASIVMASDLVERACARRGHFSPRSAYDFMRRIRLGLLKDIHPQVLGCVVKILSEAITASAIKLVLPKKVRRNKDLALLAKEYAEQEIRGDEIRVAISSLSPGMKLSRPIRAYDGKLILSGDLTLDQDLIWRIWQLSAIRPLNDPLVVKTSTASPE